MCVCVCMAMCMVCVFTVKDRYISDDERLR